MNDGPVVCKFRCQEVTKSIGYQQKILYTARFYPVADGSEENKKFFEATPSGKLEIGHHIQDFFEPGKEYFLTISEQHP